jgi:tRNA (guanine37-N1)-methyltransferase
VNIERWRREQRLAITFKFRPELVVQARNSGLLSKSDEVFLSKLAAT